VATFDNQADDFLRPLFADYRRDTMDRLRPAGALAARRGYQHWRTSRLAAAGVATAAVVLLAAGGGYLVFHRSGQPLPVTGAPTPRSTPPTTPGGSPTVAPTTAQPPAATGSPSHGQPPGPAAPPPASHGQSGTPQCHSSGLSISKQAMDGAMGQIYTTIALTNTSGQPCHLAGRPTIRAVDAADKVLPATVGDNGPGGVRVELRAGQSGYFLFQTAQPDLVEGGAPCKPPAAALLVTPPGETGSLRLPGPWGVCDASVTAVQATPPGS
jgi:hypothetical protein